jgi:hypothetical protein
VAGGKIIAGLKWLNRKGSKFYHLLEKKTPDEAIPVDPGVVAQNPRVANLENWLDGVRNTIP